MTRKLSSAFGLALASLLLTSATPSTMVAPFCTAVNNVDPNWSIARKIAYCSQFTCNVGSCWWDTGYGQYCNCV
jgi:hypothetical protein